MRAPIDAAALVILRELVADLQAGRAVVVGLTAEHDTERALAVKWREAEPGEVAEAAPLEEPAPTAAPAPQGPKPCPQCGHAETWLTQHNTLVCPACGHTVIL